MRRTWFLLMVAQGCSWISDEAYTQRLDRDGDGVLGSDDCDDDDPSRYPGAEEVPDDGVDQDCDGADATQCFADLDGDGFGDLPIVGVDGCTAAGLVDRAGDCDDTDAATHPGAPELCDTIDQDCDEVAQGEVATAVTREGTRHALTDGETIDSAEVARVELCGGTWGFALSWDPSHGDLSVEGHRGFDIPTLTTGVSAHGSERAQLRFDNLVLDPPASDDALMVLTGEGSKRPELVLEGVVLEGAELGAVIEVDEADLALDRVVIADGTFARTAVSLHQGTLVIADSELTGNRRASRKDDREGIVTATSAFVELVDSRFDTNEGRAVALVDAFAAISQTDFTDNYYDVVAPDDVSDTGGGALYVEGGSVTLQACTLSGNATDKLGGAIYSRDAELALVDSDFVGNGIAPSWTGVEGDDAIAVAGGAVAAVTGRTEVVSGSFTGNHAYLGGGALLGFGDLVVTQATFEDSAVTVSSFVDESQQTVEFGGHALLHSLGDLTLGTVTFRGFPKALDGSCVRSYDAGEVLLAGVTLVDCPSRPIEVAGAEVVAADGLALSGGTDIDGRGGGNLRVEAQEVLLQNSIFELGTTHEAGGGALIEADAVVSIGNTYRYNQAQDGGGLAVDGIELAACGDRVEGNVATRAGGGVHATFQALYSARELGCGSPSVVTGNRATGSGGGLWVGWTLDAGELEVTGNTTDGDGGGAHVIGTLYSITTSTFSSNVAGGRGGGAHLVFDIDQFSFQLGVSEPPQPFVYGSRFTENTATEGGGLSIEGSGWLGEELQSVFLWPEFTGNVAGTGAALSVASMDDTYDQDEISYDLADNLLGTLLLDDNSGSSAVQRSGPHGAWELEVTAVNTSQDLVGPASTCTIPAGATRTVTCAAGGPCTCP